MQFNQISLISRKQKGLIFVGRNYTKTTIVFPVQLRDPKNDYIFNFNFDDKMKILAQNKSALLYS